jgi:transposase
MHMTAPKTPSRRHTNEFKLQLCRDIRSGAIGRREAQRTYRISDNLIHTWLGMYDANRLESPPASTPAPTDGVHAPCEAKIAELERKVGQLTMALERRRARRLSAGALAERPDDGSSV